MASLFTHPTLVAQALVLVAMVLTPVSAAADKAIAAWWTDIGPQVMIANWTTGQIESSYCNSKDTPVWPVDKPNILSLDRQPRNNTPLTGTGWYGNEETTYASIFYQDTNYDISNAYLVCNFTTGEWMSQGSWPISVSVPSVSRNTGLSVVLLGSSAGYRLFYHDSDMTVQMLSYNSTINLWYYGGTVSDDPQLASGIAAEFTGSDNMTVVTSKDASNIEVSQLNEDGLWHISAFPDSLTNNLTWTNTSQGATNLTTSALTINSTNALNFSLASYSAADVTLGLTVDTESIRSLWYVGANKSLQQYSDVHSNGTWAPQPPQPALYWPQADDADAPLAATYSTSNYELRIYYFVGSLLTELRWDNTSATDGLWSWSQARPLPTYAAEGGGPSNSSTAAQSGGLSTGAQAGIGVGVTVAVLGLGAAGAAFFILRRKRQRAAAAGAGADGDAYKTETAWGGAGQADSANHLRGSGAGTPWGTKPGDDFSNSGGTSPLSAADALHQQQQQIPRQEMATVERPQELEGTAALYEMPDQAFGHWPPGESHDVEPKSLTPVSTRVD